MNTNSVSGQVFLVMTGFECNNNCLMCSVNPKSSKNPPRNTQEIIINIEEGRKQKFNRIEFTGGEPTIRKDLLQLIKKARDAGFGEIALGTNCRALHNLNFLKSLVENGLNRVTTTIYGYDAESHDSITGIPGSFKQSIQGVKNLLDLNILTSVNTVVFNQTAKNIIKTGNFLSSIGVQLWTLLDLIPDGYVTEKYNSLTIEPEKQKLMFRKLEPVFKKFTKVSIMDFPYCLLPSKLLTTSNIQLFNAEGRSKMIKLVGYTPKRYSEEKNVFYDLHKIRSKKCRPCAYNKGCGGTWIPYFQLYGDSFINPFSEKTKDE